jgi:hypothetical protein
MRRIALALLLTLTAFGSMAGSAEASTTSTTCANDISAGIVTRWCNVVSTAYPKVTGWYGYVGRGGGPCNSNPRGTEFPVGGSIGICSTPAPLKVWRYTKTGWVATSFPDGTRGYVAPYDTNWRWLYVGSSWYAIEARNLTLEWVAERRAQHANE